MSAPIQVKKVVKNSPYFVENVVSGVDALVAYEIKRDDEMVRYWFKDGSTVLMELNRKEGESIIFAVTHRLAVLKEAING